MSDEEGETEDSIEAVLDDMVKHTEENPSHAYNCACKGAMLRRGRKIIMSRGSAFRQEFYYLTEILTRY